MARGFLRFSSLTAFQAEGCGGGFAASFIKKGRGWRRRLCRRVVEKGSQDGPALWAGGFLSLTAFQAEGCGIALSGDEYKVSVTGLAFCIIWHDKHSADWLAALASPFPASPDFPRKRGKGGGDSHQRGNAFPRAERGWPIFPRAKARLLGFIIRGRLL